MSYLSKEQQRFKDLTPLLELAGKLIAQRLKDDNWDLEDVRGLNYTYSNELWTWYSFKAKACQVLNERVVRAFSTELASMTVEAFEKLTNKKVFN